MTILTRKKDHLEPTPIDVNKILISWKYYQGKKDKVGQTISEWESIDDGKYLKQLFEKIDYIQTVPYQTLINSQIIKLYGEFPSSEITDFSCPNDLDKKNNWGTIQKLYQNARVAGFLLKGVFYIVFLDKDHLFYKSSSFHKRRK